MKVAVKVVALPYLSPSPDTYSVIVPTFFFEPTSCLVFLHLAHACCPSPTPCLPCLPRICHALLHALRRQIARLYYGQMGAEGNMKRFVDSLQGEKMLPGYASLR